MRVKRENGTFCLCVWFTDMLQLNKNTNDNKIYIFSFFPYFQQVQDRVKSEKKYGSVVTIWL